MARMSPNSCRSSPERWKHFLTSTVATFLNISVYNRHECAGAGWWVVGGALNDLEWRGSLCSTRNLAHATESVIGGTSYDVEVGSKQKHKLSCAKVTSPVDCRQVFRHLTVSASWKLEEMAVCFFFRLHWWTLWLTPASRWRSKSWGSTVTLWTVPKVRSLFCVIQNVFELVHHWKEECNYSDIFCSKEMEANTVYPLLLLFILGLSLRKKLAKWNGATLRHAFEKELSVEQASSDLNLHIQNKTGFSCR